LKTGLGALSPRSFGGARAGRVTLVGAQAGDLAGLKQQLATAGVDAGIRTIESHVNWLWNEMLNDSLIPPDDLRSLVAALSEDA